MKVAVLFSGGKDSNMALKYAIENGWKVEALIAVKPKNTEAYLWHFATVEWTILSSVAVGVPLFLIKCNTVGAEKEAKELEKVFKRIKVDAILLGGVGLQKTQINEVTKVAKKFGINVIVPYHNYTSEKLLEEEVKSGFDIRITQVATDGLGPEWLGRKIDMKAFEELKVLSKKFGFDILGEGGSYDSFVIDGPLYKSKIELVKTSKNWNKDSGYLEVEDAKIIPK